MVRCRFGPPIGGAGQPAQRLWEPLAFVNDPQQSDIGA